MMTKRDVALEEMTKAKDTADLLVADLWSAFENSSPLAKHVIMGVYEPAMELLSAIAELHAAMEAESNAIDS